MENLPNQTPHPSFAGGIHHVYPLPCAACSPGDHSAPSTSEPPSRTARSNGLGTPSRRYGCCSQPGRHNRNNTAFSFINILAGLHFLRSKMRCRPLNLAGGVIQVPKLSKCTSASPNLLFGSHEVQITITLVKPPACQANWTLTWP